jgi:pimeloyl-ACP methyl ester carboxylesterase
MNSAIIPIKGNAQAHFADDGIEHLHWHHLRLYAREDLTVYHPRTWKTNVRNLLLQLQRHDVQHVLFIGYSHGQAAIMQAARLAPAYGIKTIRVVLCDPVWRSTWLPRIGWMQALSVRSLMSHPEIKIPATIHGVDWCRQYVDFPRAHDLVAENPRRTRIGEAVIIPRSHSKIQWSDLWFELATTAAHEFAHPPKAIPIPEP